MLLYNSCSLLHTTDNFLFCSGTFKDMKQDTPENNLHFKPKINVTLSLTASDTIGFFIVYNWFQLYPADHSIHLSKLDNNPGR